MTCSALAFMRSSSGAARERGSDDRSYRRAWRLREVDDSGGSLREDRGEPGAHGRLLRAPSSTGSCHRTWRTGNCQGDRGGGARRGIGSFYDVTRLRVESLEPLRAGHEAVFHAFDWDLGAVAGRETRVEPSDLVLLEGVYSGAPELARSRRPGDLCGHAGDRTVAPPSWPRRPGGMGRTVVVGRKAVLCPHAPVGVL